MQISQNALFDYLYCPLYFHTKHILKVPLENKKPINQCIENTLKYFYLGMLDEQEIKTYKQVQSKWDSQIKKYDFDSKIVVDGWSKVVKTLEWSKEQRLVIGDVNCEYTLSTYNHTLSGYIDYIIVYPNKDIELLYFDFSDKQLNKVDLQLKTKYVIDFFGFETVYQIKPTRIHIHHVKYNTDTFLIPDTTDFNRATSILYNVCASIENKLYIPRETMLCENCKAKPYCKFFSNNPVKGVK